MENKIETSSSAINFVYAGTYGTYLGECLTAVPRNKEEEIDAVIGKLYLDVLCDAFNSVFREIFSEYSGDDFELEYKRTSHPREYNFCTDSVVYDFAYTNELGDMLYDYAKNNDIFAKFLADNYTSCDGFISFTPNNWNEWEEGWNNNDWRCVSALLSFVLKYNVTDSERELYWYNFNDSASEIIEEQYTPFEWAEKFDNGYIGVVSGDWDDDAQATVYHCSLIDTENNIVNTCEIADYFDEEFHMSAYAVWEYSDVQRELTNGYSFGCGWHTEPCELPCNVA